MFAIFVDAITCLLLHNYHDCTFNVEYFEQNSPINKSVANFIIQTTGSENVCLHQKTIALMERKLASKPFCIDYKLLRLSIHDKQ